MKRWSAGRFVRHKGGATAVEFSLVALPFFALLFVIIEVGFVYFSNSSLDDALRRTTDDVQTGVAQEQRWTRDQYRERLCSRLPVFMTCENLIFDLRVLTEDAFDNHMISGDVRDITSAFRQGARLAYCLGNGGEYMLARVSYRFPSFIRFVIERAMTIDGVQVYSTEASRVFRNEPFLTEAPKCRR